MTPKHRAGAFAALLASAMLALTACAPVVALTPAKDATNPGCAEIIVRLPKSVSGQPIRETNAQATAAWGNPASVLLHCGVAVPGPSTLVCVTLRGIDWLYDPSGAPNYVFTTFGRDPATQVVVDGNKTSGTNTLVDLASAIGSIHATRQCTSPDDVLGENSGPKATPVPLPSPSVTP